MYQITAHVKYRSQKLFLKKSISQSHQTVIFHWFILIDSPKHKKNHVQFSYTYIKYRKTLIMWEVGGSKHWFLFEDNSLFKTD